MVKYIPNGYDENLSKFKIDKELVDKYNLKDKFTVVYIGNVGLAQNLDALVDIATKTKNNNTIQFIIFGEGAYKNNIENKIKKLNLTNIFAVGKIDYSKVYTILSYSKISFISLKNKKMVDSVPTKMFDALGLGCPILLLAKGDSCDILDLVKLGEHVEDEELLNEKFECMIDNYQHYKQNANYSIEYIKNNYSRRNIAKKFESEVLKYVK